MKLKLALSCSDGVRCIVAMRRHHTGRLIVMLAARRGAAPARSRAALAACDTRATSTHGTTVINMDYSDSLGAPTIMLRKYPHSNFNIRSASLLTTLIQQF